ncbi:DUF7504 family protein [Halobaculum sp. EA56]|uniref:DUF7504 family protein n=1 Tax=Halobaculum sp. EA56 TaxID=3421648 RepID=UPI003EBD2565
MTDDYRSVDHSFLDDSSVLLVAPAYDPPDDEACIDLLTPVDPGQANVLSVTLEATPDERLSVWMREVGGTLPSRARVIDGGSGATRASQAAASGEFPTVDVEVLPEDGDLVDLALSIGSTLGEWEATDVRSTLCLHSLSALLDSFPREDVIGLVNGLNDRCERLGVLAHHHIDPDAHDEETLATLRPLYDTVVEHVPDEGWIVASDEGSSADPSFRAATTPPVGPGDADLREPEAVPIPYSFDTVLDLISHPRRRTLLYMLRACPDDEIGLDRLADAVHERERSIPVRDPPGSRDALLTSLVHVHLPKLEDVGVIGYDADAEVVRYHPNPALESCVRYVETLELG